MGAWIERLLMGMRFPQWRRGEDAAVPGDDEPPLSTEATRQATALNTLETDRQIRQIVESATRQTARVERRAEHSAAVLRHMAEQACILSDATRSGRNP